LKAGRELPAFSAQFQCGLEGDRPLVDLNDLPWSDDDIQN
jgi:hypothetical protein